MTTVIRARDDGEPGVVFVVAGKECPLDEHEARRLIEQLRKDGATVIAHMIEECLVTP